MRLAVGLTLALAVAPASAGAAEEAFDCLECHDPLPAGSAHEDAATCQECHADVTDETHEEEGARPVDCAGCHEEIAAAATGDVHRRLAERVGGRAPDCKGCHGTHEIVYASDSADPVADFCADCHDDVLLERPYHALGSVPDAECLDCHDEAAETPALLAASVHRGVGCGDCHAYSAAHLEEHQEDLPFDRVADCALCHRQETLAHRESIHGLSLARGVEEAAACWSCHGGHAIAPVAASDSPVRAEHLPRTCGRCHDDLAFGERFPMHTTQPAAAYARSVHGLLVAQGRMEAASCVLCHGVHDIKNRVQPGSRIAPLAVPDTCGACHAEVAAEYRRSTHWVGAQRGIKNAPVCNDCHGEHAIEGIHLAQADEHQERRIQEETCLRCHANPMVARRYGLEADRVASYRDSYHGMAARRGDQQVAFCVDCHGVHAILPQRHPESTVSAERVLDTCRTCHPTATAAFAASYTHERASPSNRSLIYWVETLYAGAIWLIVGVMLAHNALLFGTEVRARWRRAHAAITIPRFTASEVIQHLLLGVAFLVLVLTGFALTYPDTWAFRWMTALHLTESVRQWIHRAASVVLLAAGAWHLAGLAFTRRGREVRAALWPRARDVRAGIANVAYHLGWRAAPPEFDEFDYTEKVEYWALVWGTAIMAVTGLVLWFPEAVTRGAPAWVIELSTVVHFYEALLASLAVLIWHGFFVVLHPRTYPLSFSMVDGRIALDEHAEHHRRAFKHMLLEWARVRAGHVERADVSPTTARTLGALARQGHDPDAVLGEYLERDHELRAWVERRLQED